MRSVPQPARGLRAWLSYFIPLSLLSFFDRAALVSAPPGLVFDTRCPPRFNDDDVVIRHELGHALAWHSLGESVRHIRFVRVSGGLLFGATGVVSPPTATPLEALDPAQLVALATRALAGEIAARRYLGLPQNVVSSAFPIRPQEPLKPILDGRGNDPSDLVKALFMAFHATGEDWYPWLAERHLTTVSLVASQWNAIERLAVHLTGQLPAHTDEELIVSGEQLLAMS
jgi:hypothetical protein